MSGKHVVHVEVEVKDGNVDRALKQFSRKVHKLGVLEELKEKMVYTKPSERRNKIKQKVRREQKRRRRQRYKNDEEI